MQKKYNKKYRHFNRSSKMINDSIHAEMSCLVNIPKCVDLNLDYSKCKVYIYRISPGKRLQIGLARPCEACMNALRDKGIRKIYYTTDGSEPLYDQDTGLELAKKEGIPFVANGNELD